MKRLSLLFLLCAQIIFAEEIPQNIETAIEKHNSETKWNLSYYDVLPKVINEKGFSSLLEIGVAFGNHAAHILRNTSIEHYFGVDPYHFNYDERDAFNVSVAAYGGQSGQYNYDCLHSWVANRFESFGERATLIRNFSVEAAKDFPDGSLDCIFIDGDHRFHAVLADLEAWYPKLRSGGMMLGDDYWMKDVERAVKKFFLKKHVRVRLIPSKTGYLIWSIEKP